MFALEIIFNDGVSQPEVVFIRRPQALIGASDFAHVAVEDLKSLNYQLRVVRDFGRRFRCLISRGGAGDSVTEEFRYDKDAALDVGPVRFHITTIDVDLALREGEPPDRAGVRVLRQACSSSSPLFPAVVVGGAHPMIVSFVADQPIYVGRSRQCAIRLDSADVSARHARIGYEGGEFWIEDLGSTNGTFVNQQQISGRVNVPAGMPIVVGREISLVGVITEEQITAAPREVPSISDSMLNVERSYPALVALSEVARPARLVLALGQSYSLGRDPSSDVWLGAPHVSRRHCVVGLDPTGRKVIVTDYSTNGTAHDGGILHRGEQLPLEVQGTTLDFGSGVMVAICFNTSEEQAQLAAHPMQRIEQPARVGSSDNITQESRSPFAAEQEAARAAAERSVAGTGTGTGIKNAPLSRRLLLVFKSLPIEKKLLVIMVLVMFLVVMTLMFSLVTGILRA